MTKTITSDMVVAYSQCPRKAFLLSSINLTHDSHEYVHLLKMRRDITRDNFFNALKQKNIETKQYNPNSLKFACEVYSNVCLNTNGLSANCDFLKKAEEPSALGNFCYVPIICIGTYTISKEFRVLLIYAAYVLEKIQKTYPKTGQIITFDNKVHKINLKSVNKTLSPLLKPLKSWIFDKEAERPSIFLNRHCLICQFNHDCRSKALEADHLSLLSRATSKIISKYEKKGIFTVKQLSYVFKPRKRRKDNKKSILIHNLELQALALREKKTFVHTLPTISRQPTELFIDIEGIPDQQFYYLFGLLIKDADTSTFFSFWAESYNDEKENWQRFLVKLNQYANVPVFHFGSFEPRAIAKLAKRYETDIESLKNRLVNVNTIVDAKIYFPVYSNSLKEIGAFIGAKWSAINASGIKSLVWRYKWEQTSKMEYKSKLIKYNAEDCYALKIVVDKLFEIIEYANTLDSVEFADKRKQKMSNLGKEIHNQFNAIRKLSYHAYEKKKISFSPSEQCEVLSKEKKREKSKISTAISHKKRAAARQKAKRIVEVPIDEFCPVCRYKPLRKTEKVATRTIFDIVSYKNGLRQTLTNYIGFIEYCTKCSKYFSPAEIRKYKATQIYGHGFKAWIVYQRVELRLPYSSIRTTAKEYFNQDISMSCLPDIIQDLGLYYQDTKKSIMQHLLANKFIHADETRINIQGVNQYVWVFTDGRYVTFELTETREATIVHEILAGFKGVLISDFYPGYDSVSCTQQKCWCHLIRDINKDLLESPFDTEFEMFAWEVKNLIVPIMRSVQKYGLKLRHLRKYQKEKNKFYKKIILNKEYESEFAVKYQKRFIRYKDSLFTFIEVDGIPWHNNTAEVAIRHVAKQRSISRNFFASVMSNYLILLGIKQACRFQNKSFFKFLLSGEKDLDQFGRRRHRKYAVVK